MKWNLSRALKKKEENRRVCNYNQHKRTFCKQKFNFQSWDRVDSEFIMQAQCDEAEIGCWYLHLCCPVILDMVLGSESWCWMTKRGWGGWGRDGVGQSPWRHKNMKMLDNNTHHMLQEGNYWAQNHVRVPVCGRWGKVIAILLSFGRFCVTPPPSFNFCDAA